MRTTHEWGDVTATVFQLNTGEAIPRHKHPFIHSTRVIRGSVRVDIDGEASFAMRSVSDRDMILPADIDHEITALEDDTIIVNMHTPPPPGQKGDDGGITFDD